MGYKGLLAKAVQLWLELVYKMKMDHLHNLECMCKLEHGFELDTQHQYHMNPGKDHDIFDWYMLVDSDILNLKHTLVDSLEELQYSLVDMSKLDFHQPFGT